jgi:aminomethyltransferase
MTRRTPLYARHVALGGRMVDFAGWEMPQQYSSVRGEHLAVRKAVGLFDVSHMGRLRVTGSQAPEALNHLVTNDLGVVEGGHAQYNLMCDEAGGVLDDLILYRGNDDGWTIVFNAGNREKDLAWFQKQLTAAELLDLSEMTGLLALQGPKAVDVLAPLTDVDVASLPYFGFAGGRVAGVEPVAIARTGYTGEDGFEIVVPAAHAAALWQALRDAGVAPCGLGARDTLRLEAGMNLYGQDMDESVSPLESGLAWTVDLASGRDFVGRDALLARVAARKLVGLVLQDPGGVLRAHQVVHTDLGDGEVTSGTFSPTLNTSIALARVPAGVAGGDVVRVDVRGRALHARIVKPPFVRHGKVLV